MPSGLFLLVTFGFSWPFALIQYQFHNETTTTAQVVRTLLSVAFMFGPLVGTVVAQRRAAESIFKPLGVSLRVNKWWLVAWLAPFLYAGLSFVVSLAFPGIEFAPDFSGFFDRLGAVLPASELAEARQALNEIPKPMLGFVLVAQMLFGGLTINAIAAFGEEIGWRGYLYRAWTDKGFWRSSLLIGAIWGLWHAPLIAQGHNYPQHPLIGILFMTVWCMLLAPPFTYLRQRSGSVIAVSIAHGTLNAAAGFPLLLTGPGSDLLIGVTGVGGFLVLVVVNVVLAFVIRNESPASRAAIRD